MHTGFCVRWRCRCTRAPSRLELSVCCTTRLVLLRARDAYYVCARFVAFTIYYVTHVSEGILGPLRRLRIPLRCHLLHLRSFAGCRTLRSRCHAVGCCPRVVLVRLFHVGWLVVVAFWIFTLPPHATYTVGWCRYRCCAPVTFAVMWLPALYHGTLFGCTFPRCGCYLPAVTTHPIYTGLHTVVLPLPVTYVTFPILLPHVYSIYALYVILLVYYRAIVNFITTLFADSVGYRTRTVAVWLPRLPHTPHPIWSGLRLCRITACIYGCVARSLCCRSVHYVAFSRTCCPRCGLPARLLLHAQDRLRPRLRSFCAPVVCVLDGCGCVCAPFCTFCRCRSLRFYVLPFVAVTLRCVQFVAAARCRLRCWNRFCLRGAIDTYVAAVHSVPTCLGIAFYVTFAITRCVTAYIAIPFLAFVLRCWAITLLLVLPLLLCLTAAYRWMRSIAVTRSSLPVAFTFCAVVRVCAAILPRVAAVPLDAHGAFSRILDLDGLVAFLESSDRLRLRLHLLPHYVAMPFCV